MRLCYYAEDNYIIKLKASLRGSEALGVDRKQMRVKVTHNNMRLPYGPNEHTITVKVLMLFFNRFLNTV